MKTMLAVFTPQERQPLMALFFKTGVWISQIDATSSDPADLTEQKALQKLLARIEKDTRREAFVRELAYESLRQKDNWPRWEVHPENYLAETNACLHMLVGRCSEKELQDLKWALLHIAEHVALANDEGEDAVDVYGGDHVPFFPKMLEKLGLKKPERNISPAEDDALTALAHLMRGI